MITAKRVTKQYTPRHYAVCDLSFSVSKGEMLIVKGHSGAGKSTLLNLIGGLEPLSSGELLVDNIKIHQLSARRIPAYRRRLGIIAQKPLLLANRSVYDNVAIPLILQGLPRLEIIKRIQSTLESVKLLNKASSLAHDLSAGEQQRLSIARAIIHTPSLLLADEPTNHLDNDLAKDIMRLFSSLHQKGTTIVLTTHDDSLIESSLADYPYRILSLTQGQITCTR